MTDSTVSLKVQVLDLQPANCADATDDAANLIDEDTLSAGDVDS